MVYKISTGSVSPSSITTELINDDAVTAAKLDDNFSLGVVPIGGIIMYSGLNAPNGYVFCDDSQAAVAAGAPDLRDKFIVGSTPSSGSTTYPTLALDATGGSADAVVVQHNHTTSNFSDPGNHNHSINIQSLSIQDRSDVRNDDDKDAVKRITITSGDTGNDGAHIHTFDIDDDGVSGLNKNLPPYYALAFIMRVT